MDYCIIKSNYLLNVTDEEIREKNLIKKMKDDYILFKYNRNIELTNIEEIMECRGLIVKDNKFICLPPKKNMDQNIFFSKYNLNDCKIEVFIDGTMVNIYWDNGKINYSTRSQINADEKNFGILKKTFQEMFLEVYKSYNFELDRCLPDDICLSCVLCHVENPIVKRHSNNKIYLVEAKKISGDKYLNLDIHNCEEIREILFERPELFDFQNLKEIENFLDTQNYDYKGFIIKNKDEKTKIENNKYLSIKNLRKLDIKDNRVLYYTLKQNNEIQKYLTLFPEYNDIFIQYKKDFEKLVDIIYLNYRKRWVFKENKVNSIKELEYETRPIIFELHKKYLNDNIIITKKIVHDLVIELPIYSIIHTLKII